MPPAKLPALSFGSAPAGRASFLCLAPSPRPPCPPPALPSGVGFLPLHPPAQQASPALSPALLPTALPQRWTGLLLPRPALSSAPHAVLPALPSSPLPLRPLRAQPLPTHGGDTPGVSLDGVFSGS